MWADTDSVGEPDQGLRGREALSRDLLALLWRLAHTLPMSLCLMPVPSVCLLCFTGSRMGPVSYNLPARNVADLHFCPEYEFLVGFYVGLAAYLLCCRKTWDEW